MSFSNGAWLEAITANNRTGRIIRTSGAIVFILACSYVAGMRILGPMLADAAGIKPGNSYTVRGGSEDSPANKVEPKAPPLEISSKTDPDMQIVPVIAKSNKSFTRKKKEEAKPVPQTKPPVDEKKTELVPPPNSTPDPIDPPEPKPPTDGDKDPGKSDGTGIGN